jgi:hypothetical protein
MSKKRSFIKIQGVLDTLVDIAPDVHKACVTKDKKCVAQLLVQCQNATYGTMVASLLCYRKFAKSLTSIGFVINPCDPCVTNKMVRGKQLTICWHVDNLKVSHVMPKVMDRMIKCLRKEHESMFEDGLGAMEVSRGKTHKCLGMTLDYDVQGQASVTMFDHLNDTLTVFEKIEPNDGGGTKTKAQHLPICSRSTKTVSNFQMKTVSNFQMSRPWSLTTSSPRRCVSPSGPGQTPAPQSRS